MLGLVGDKAQKASGEKEEKEREGDSFSYSLECFQRRPAASLLPLSPFSLSLFSLPSPFLPSTPDLSTCMDLERRKKASAIVRGRLGPRTNEHETATTRSAELGHKSCGGELCRERERAGLVFLCPREQCTRGYSRPGRLRPVASNLLSRRFLPPLLRRTRSCEYYGRFHSRVWLLLACLEKVLPLRGRPAADGLGGEGRGKIRRRPFPKPFTLPQTRDCPVDADRGETDETTTSVTSSRREHSLNARAGGAE